MSVILVFDSRGRPVEPPSLAFAATMRDLSAAMRMSLWALTVDLAGDEVWANERRRRLERTDRAWEARS